MSAQEDNKFNPISKFLWCISPRMPILRPLLQTIREILPFDNDYICVSVIEQCLLKRMYNNILNIVQIRRGIRI